MEANEQAKDQPKIQIKNNDSAENKDITLMIPQEADAQIIKNALIALLEFVIRVEWDKLKAKHAEEEAKKAEPVTPELVKE